jgi:5-methylcytosine-specific restriction enzyme subunit McrC
VGVGTRSWPVHPKIDLDHFIYLLQSCRELPKNFMPKSSTETKGAMGSGTTLWELVYDWFLTATESLIRGDLAKGYQRETNTLPFVRGSIDVLALSRGLLQGRTSVQATYDEFTVDIPVNRILKSALLRGLRSNKLGTESARRTRRLLARFSAVSEASHRDKSFVLERNTYRYSDAITLALQILRTDVLKISLGSTQAWCFLWRTPLAVESAIRSVLQAGLCDVAQVSSASRRCQPSLDFNPDLRFRGITDTETTLAVGDIKYSLVKELWRRSDVNQLLAFTVAFECNRALLINFHYSGPVQASAEVAGTQLERFSWRLDRTPEEAGQLLVHQVRNWLSA